MVSMAAQMVLKPASSASSSERPVFPTPRSKTLKMPVPSTPGNSSVSSPASLAAFVPATRPIWFAVSPRGIHTAPPLTRLTVSTQSPAAHTSRRLVLMCLSTRIAPLADEPFDLRPGVDADAVLLDVLLDLLRYLGAVGEGDPVFRLDEGDLHPEPAEVLGDLEPDVTSPDHHCLL